MPTFACTSPTNNLVETLRRNKIRRHSPFLPLQVQGRRLYCWARVSFSPSSCLPPKPKMADSMDVDPPATSGKPIVFTETSSVHPHEAVSRRPTNASHSRLDSSSISEASYRNATSRQDHTHNGQSTPVPSGSGQVTLGKRQRSLDISADDGRASKRNFVANVVKQEHMEVLLLGRIGKSVLITMKGTFSHSEVF